MIIIIIVIITIIIISISISNSSMPRAFFGVGPCWSSWTVSVPKQPNKSTRRLEQYSHVSERG